MAVTEQARHHLYAYFAETMGEERAATLMDLLPPTGWGDVATKQDLALMRTDLEHVRVDLRKEIEHLRATTQNDIAHLAELTQKEFASLRNELKGHLDRALRIHTLATVTVFMAMPSAMAAWTQLL